MNEKALLVTSLFTQKNRENDDDISLYLQKKLVLYWSFRFS